jgi:hypothetical protein
MDRHDVISGTVYSYAYRYEKMPLYLLCRTANMNRHHFMPQNVSEAAQRADDPCMNPNKFVVLYENATVFSAL